MVLYLTVNQFNSCHGCVCGPLTRDAKDILWMDDLVLIMTRESMRHTKHAIMSFVSLGVRPRKGRDGMNQCSRQLHNDLCQNKVQTYQF